MTIDEFIRSNALGMTSRKCRSNPHFAIDEKWAREASHWLCTILRAADTPAPDAMATYYSMGSAHKDKPKLADVLDSLASDAAGVAEDQSFEQWASEYDFDADSRKAERSYRATREQTARLRAFLSESAFAALVNDVERL